MPSDWLMFSGYVLPGYAGAFFPGLSPTKMLRIPDNSSAENDIRTNIVASASDTTAAQMSAHECLVSAVVSDTLANIVSRELVCHAT